MKVHDIYVLRQCDLAGLRDTLTNLLIRVHDPAGSSCITKGKARLSISRDLYVVALQLKDAVSLFEYESNIHLHTRSCYDFTSKSRLLNRPIHEFHDISEDL